MNHRGPRQEPCGNATVKDKPVRQRSIDRDTLGSASEVGGEPVEGCTGNTKSSMETLK